MDELTKKKIRKIQEYFNPINLEPVSPSPEGLPGMTEEQRRLFEKAVQGNNQKSGVILPKAPELSDMELEAISNELRQGEVKPALDVSEEEPKRFKKLLK